MSDRVFYCSQIFGDSIQQFPPHYVEWAKNNYGVSTADKLRKACFPMNLMTGAEIREMLGSDDLLPAWEVTNLKNDVQTVVDRYYGKGPGKDGKGKDGKGEGKGEDAKGDAKGKDAKGKDAKGDAKGKGEGKGEGKGKGPLPAPPAAATAGIYTRLY